MLRVFGCVGEGWLGHSSICSPKKGLRAPSDHFSCSSLPESLVLHTSDASYLITSLQESRGMYPGRVDLAYPPTGLDILTGRREGSSILIIRSRCRSKTSTRALEPSSKPLGLRWRTEFLPARSHHIQTD